ncbi:hypothetical protein [Ectobacillus ponti]|uniref:Uncharacterized protein n=1 Tax=Ectobacillus ponti TaxID=2961894 RepID=A0AA41X983_9BACI|nr:hypothetical protein [Ectobacillus ponti]MCP8969200.1 hypothetical protein [Ectobacillus ponti]
MAEQIEIQGCILPGSHAQGMDHGEFLQELNAFLAQHGWTFSGSTRQTEGSIAVIPDPIPPEEPPL